MPCQGRTTREGREKRQRFFVSVAVFLIICAFSVPARAWVTGVVDRLDTGGSGGRHTSIAVDSEGAIHVSSCNEALSALQYSTNALGSWVTTTADSAGNVGWDTSIALDDSGKVHISCFDSTNSHLKYATNASGS